MMEEEDKNDQIIIQAIESEEKEEEEENKNSQIILQEIKDENNEEENNENNQEVVLQEIYIDEPTDVNNNAPQKKNNNINIINLDNSEKEVIKIEKSDDNSKDNQIPLYGPNKQNYTFKIIVLGDIAVGKTSFINRYITNNFSEENKSSISTEFKSKKIDLDGETSVDLQIWDTAGQERYMSVTRQCYNDSHGAIIIFDLTNENTILNIDKWIGKLKENAPKDIIISVVGNKSDLVNERIDLEKELKPYKNNLYFEVSAKQGENVSLVFERLTKEIITKINEKKEKGENLVSRDSISLKKRNSFTRKKKKKWKC